MMVMRIVEGMWEAIMLDAAVRVLASTTEPRLRSALNMSDEISSINEGDDKDWWRSIGRHELQPCLRPEFSQTQKFAGRGDYNFK